MTNLRIKWALFVFTILLFGFYLLPSIRYYSLPATPPEGLHADTTGFAVAAPRWRGSQDPAVTKL
ncbi:MAG TPA: hypothetical protein VFP10_15190, partial [Candidatus Eisenbacteria bacterium]|nr:hypothetical protein [Candidatus Eisenbacteria bacterium]